MTGSDRERICATIAAQPERLVVVTHGTDTMIETARVLGKLTGKTVVLTGSMQPARFRVSDAEFNLGTAVAAVQILPPGVYLAMNGRIFDPRTARKNVAGNCFERLP
jgi:L-asparaginase